MKVEVERAAPATCRNCKGNNFLWYIHLKPTDHAPGHNLLSLHDVKAVGVLGCEDCSETIMEVPIEDIEDTVNKFVKIQKIVDGVE